MSAEPHNAEERIVGLIARHQPEIHRYILSLMPDRMLADDVAQETNLVLWRTAAEYDPAQPFLPWALTIALYQVKAARRDAGRDRHVFDDSLVEILAAECREETQGDLEQAAGRGQTPTALSLALMRIRKALETCIERKLATP